MNKRALKFSVAIVMAIFSIVMGFWLMNAPQSNAYADAPADAVAKLAGTDVYVTNLDDAFTTEVNPTGKQVILLKDYTGDVDIENGAHSFYLNGYTLTGTLKLSGGTVNVYGTLAGVTPEGSESIIQNTGLDGNYAIHCYSGNLNLGAVTVKAMGENGTAIYSDGNKLNVNGDVNVTGNVETGVYGIISITEGTYNGSLIEGKDSSLEVVGGKFSSDPSTCVPFGYLINQEDGYYVVSPDLSYSLDSLDKDETGAYLISDEQDVVIFRTLLSTSDGKNILIGEVFKLTNDIDMQNATLKATGNDSKRFMGTFNGQNYAIKNVNIQADGETYVAFFGNISGATIKDLTLENITVNGGSYTAGLVGFTRNSTIENCKVTGNINITGTSHVGGVHAGGVVNITNCEVSGNGTISGTIDVGAISGLISQNSTVVTGNTVSGITVKGDGLVGGLIGRAIVGESGLEVSGNNLTDVSVESTGTSYSQNGLAVGCTQASAGQAKYEENIVKDSVLTVNGQQSDTVYCTQNYDGADYSENVEAKLQVVVNGEPYASFEDALNAVKSMTGDVVVELYDKVTLKSSFTGSYDKITFVGKSDKAEIYLEVQGYITATGKKVAFEKLTLSKSAGGFINNAGFMNVAFGVYDVVEVNYTNCTFINGSYASSGKVTYADCTFYKSHEKYGLWAYGDVDATVVGGKFSSLTENDDNVRGIKMYAEGAKKTTDLTVEDVDFSDVNGKPAIVLTYGESVTLKGNNYSSTGVFELDLDGSPDGTALTADITDIACKNDNGSCGVLVDGKIYTTVESAVSADVVKKGSEVTLMYAPANEIVLPYGVILNTNNNANVSVKEADLTITTAQEFIDFANQVNSGNQYRDKVVVLGANIDLNGSETNLWTPIGENADGSKKFYGTFDGNDYVISNLYVKQGAGYHGAGLFGATCGEIRNFTIDGAYVESISSGSATVNGTAVVAGSTAYGATISNVHVKNATVKGNRYVAGIVGYMDGSVINCSVENVNITATPDNLTGSYDNGDKVGGIVGYCNSGAVEISACELKGELNITAYRDVAGIVGCVNSTVEVNENVNDAEISITIDTVLCGELDNYNVGEFVGRNTPASTSTPNQTTSNATYTQKVFAPKGKIATGVVLDEGNGSYIYFDLSNLNAEKSIVIKVYSDDTLLATTTLVKDSYLSYSALSTKVCITATSSSWATTWEADKTYALVPNYAELYVDGVKVSSVDKINMYNTDNPANARDWWEIDGVTAPVEITLQNGQLKKFATLQSAIDFATATAGDYEIILNGQVDESIEIHQTESVNLTIKGDCENSIFTGYIKIYGHARSQGAETLTFDGIVFSTSVKNHLFIEQQTQTSQATSNEECYPHNVTIKNCEFIATGDAVNTAVGVKFRMAYNTVIKDVVSTDMHSLAQLTACANGVLIENVEIKGKNGISLNTSYNDITVKNVKIDALGYGLRADANNGQYETNLVVKDCQIEAFIPVVVRDVKADDYYISFAGTNVMTAENSDGFWCAIGATEYEENGVLPKPATEKVEIAIEGNVEAGGAEICQPLVLSGEGTQEKPFIVRDLRELQLLRDKVNAGENYDNKYILLTADIDLEGKEWTPIGTSSNPFNGYFDGGNHTISNLYINWSKNYVSGGANENYVGLFGYMKGGNNSGIANLTVENAQISGCLYVGVILGRSYTGGIIDNCHVKGIISVDAYSYAGGIVGRHEYSANSASIAIRNCSVEGIGQTGIINCDYQVSYAGGIVGFLAEGNYAIEDVWVKNVEIKGTYGLGGISGIGHYGNSFDQVSVEEVVVTSINNNPESPRTGNVGLVIGACQGTESQPTVIENYVIEQTQATVNGEEIKNVFGNNMNGSAPVTNYVAKVGENYYKSFQEVVDSLLNGNVGSGDVVIELYEDVVLPYGARTKYGVADTNSITINANGKTITLDQTNSDWSSIGMANQNGKFVINNAKVVKTGHGATSGAWNKHAVIFDCLVEMNNVEFNNSLAVKNGAVLNDVVIKEANGYYGLWITANGQEVVMNGGAINATNGGRGIKIADEYVDNVETVELSVTDTVFNTAKKAAVLITSNEGANITVENIDITNVKEDNTNVVWVDEDRVEGYNASTVTGGTINLESDDKVVATISVQNAIKYYSTLENAIADAVEGDVITLVGDLELDEAIVVGVDKVITLDLNNLTLSGKSNVLGTCLIKNEGNLTIKNGVVTYEYTGAADPSFGKGNYTIVNGGILTVEDATIENTTAYETNHMHSAVDNNSTSRDVKLVLNSGKIVNEKYVAVRQFANSATYKNEVIVNGGEIIAGKRAVYVQLLNSNEANAVKASTVINDGVLTSYDDEYCLAVYVYGYSTNLTNVELRIFGGTFNGNVALNGKASLGMVEGQLEIAGGTFNGQDGVFGYDEIGFGFISGGTFVCEVPEEYWTPGYVVIAQDGAYVAMSMSEFSVIVAVSLREVAEQMIIQKVYNDAGVNAFENAVTTYCAQISNVLYMSEVERIVQSAMEAFNKVLTEIEAKELATEYSIAVKEYAELKKVDVKDSTVATAIENIYSYATKYDMMIALELAYEAIDQIALDKATALENAKTDAINTLMGANLENKNDVTSAMIASIYACDTVEKVEIALAVAQTELAEIKSYKALLVNASTKAEESASEIANVKDVVSRIETTFGADLETLKGNLTTALTDLLEIKEDAQELVNNAVTKDNLTNEISLINQAIAKVTEDVNKYIEDEVISLITKQNEDYSKFKTGINEALSGLSDDFVQVKDALSKINPLSESQVRDLLAEGLESVEDVLEQIDADVKQNTSAINGVVSALEQSINGILEKVEKATEELGKLSGNISSLNTMVDQAKQAVDQAKDLAEQAKENSELAKQAAELAKQAAEKVQTTEVKVHAALAKEDVEKWIEEYLNSLTSALSEGANDSASAFMVSTFDSTNAGTITSDAYRQQLEAKLEGNYTEANRNLILAYYDQVMAQISAAVSKAEIDLAVETFKTNVALVDTLETLTPAPRYNDTAVIVLLVVIVVVEAVIAVILLVKVLKAKKQNDDGNDGDDGEQQIVATEDEEVEVEEEVVESEDAQEESAEDVETESAFANIKGVSKTFEQKLSEADDLIKEGFTAISEKLLGYKKVNQRVSKKAVSFRNGRKLIAKMTIVGKTLRVYLALDPNAYEVSKLFQKDASDKKAYEEVPMLMRVRSGRAIKRTINVISDLADKFNLELKPEPKQ